MDHVSGCWSCDDLIENTCAAPGSAKEEMTASNSCLLFKVKSRDIKLSIINYCFIEKLIIIAFLGAEGCMNLPWWSLVNEMQFSIPGRAEWKMLLYKQKCWYLPAPSLLPVTPSSGKGEGLSSGKFKAQQNTFLSALAGVVLNGRNRFKERVCVWGNAETGTLCMDDASKNIANLFGGKDYPREKWTQGIGYSAKKRIILVQLKKITSALIIRSWLKQIGGSTSPICNKKWYKAATWSGRV